MRRYFRGRRPLISLCPEREASYRDRVRALFCVSVGAPLEARREQPVHAVLEP
jgi:hypothetical protein